MSVSTNERGLCDLCAPELALTIDTVTRRLQRSVRLAESSSRVVKQLQRWTAVQEHASRLEPLEESGIEVSDPPPSHYLELYRRSRDRILNEGVRAEVDALLARAHEATSVRAAVRIADRAATLVRQAQANGDSRTLRELALRVRNFINDVQVNAFLTKARRAERSGQHKRALEQYRGALYFLLNDEIDDRVQRHQISAVREKVEALSGGL